MLVLKASTLTAPWPSSATPACSSPSPLVCGARPVATRYLIDIEIAVVGQFQAQALFVFVDLGRQHAESLVEPRMGERIAQALAHGLVETAQNIAGAKQQRHFRAEPRENAGELHRDIAAADHGEAARKFFEIENLVRADGVLQSGKDGKHRGAGPCGDQNMSGRDDAPALDQTHFMRPDDFGALFKNLDAGLVEIGLVDVGKAGDFAFLGGDKLAPVEFRRFWQTPAKSFGIGEILRESARRRHRVFWARSRE